jgi:hypothetical protein
MNITIRIIYTAIDVNSKSLRSGSFPLKGRKPEKVAYEFWKWIKSEEPLELVLEKVVLDGEEITELVKGIDEAPLE